MNIVTYISIASTLAVTILCLFKFNNSNPIKWISLYCIAGALIEIASTILALNGIPNILLYYVLIWLEVFTILLFFTSSSNTINKLSPLWLFALVYLILLLILLFLDSTKSLHPYSGIFESLLIFIAGLISFNDELRAPKYSDILREPFFWFTASLILFYGCNSFILIGAKLFSFEKESFNYIWNYQNLLSILKNIMIFIGLVLYRE